MKMYLISTNQSINAFRVVGPFSGEEKRLLATGLLRLIEPCVPIRRVVMTREQAQAMGVVLFGEPVEPGSYIVYGEYDNALQRPWLRYVLNVLALCAPSEHDVTDTFYLSYRRLALIPIKS